MTKKVQLSEDFIVLTKKLQNAIEELNRNIDVILTGERCLSAAKRARKFYKDIEKMGVEWRRLLPKRY